MKRCSHKKIVEDFEYLYKNLEASHYNLYVNQSKETFDAEYERIIETIPRSLTILEIYRLFQPFVALSGMEHCTTVIPVDAIKLKIMLEGVQKGLS